MSHIRHYREKKKERKMIDNLPVLLGNALDIQ